MPLGLEDKRLTPGDISASSYYNAYLAPWYGRLNHIYSWSVRTRNSKQWMKVSFGDVMRFKGIATQGRSNANQWVMSYVMTYSGDGVTYVPYKERRRVKVRDTLFSSFKTLSSPLIVLYVCNHRNLWKMFVFSPLFTGILVRIQRTNPERS